MREEDKSKENGDAPTIIHMKMVKRIEKENWEKPIPSYMKPFNVQEYVRKEFAGYSTEEKKAIYSACTLAQKWGREH